MFGRRKLVNSIDVDLYNSRSRLWDYNCYSFATGMIDDWRELLTWGELRWMGVFSKGDYPKEYQYKMIEEILQNNEFLIYLGSYESVTPYFFDDTKQYVLFRYSFDDFHFVLRDFNGTYYDKPGKQRVRTIREPYVIGNLWLKGIGYEQYPNFKSNAWRMEEYNKENPPYDSDLIIFEVVGKEIRFIRN